MGGLVDFIRDPTGARGLASAQREASQLLQQNIDRGMTLAEAQQAVAQQQLQSGQAQGLQSLQQGQQALGQGLEAQQGFLQQAQGQFGSQAGLLDPALANLQATGTAGGRAQALQGILADPNQAGLFNELNRTTQNSLSGLSARRSGFGIGETQRGQLGLANQLLSQQDAAQQNLANIGIGGTGNIAQLLAQQGQASALGGGALSSGLTNIGQFQQAGGAQLAGLTQQGTANQLNLLGQLGQAESAGILGPAQSQAAGNQALLGLGGNLLGGFLSDRRAKENIKAVGQTDAGLTIYVYNYKGEEVMQMGVMAQEAMRMFPNAVVERDDGLLAVKYGEIK